MNSIIWRESIYKNNFRCNRCKTKLANEYGTPNDNVGVNATDEDDKRMFCRKCMNIIAEMGEVPDGITEGGGLHGLYSDFQMRIAEKEKQVKAEMRFINMHKKKIAELEQENLILKNQIKNLKADRDKIRENLNSVIYEKEKEIISLNKRMDEIIDSRLSNN